MEIDAKLAARAHVESIDETANGEVVRSLFEFVRENGDVAVAAETVTLVADPGHLRTLTSEAGSANGKGLMAVTWAVEALAASGMPDTFDLTARFLAPLFWDDGVDVLGDRGGDGTIGEIHFRSSSGVEAAAVTIHGTP